MSNLADVTTTYGPSRNTMVVNHGGKARTLYAHPTIPGYYTSRPRTAK